MPKAQMEDAPKWRLPAETVFPAQLQSVTVRTIKFQKNGEDRSFDKWVWEFMITEGEFSPLKAIGETDAALTNHPNNKVRPWAEALRGAEFQLGEDLDTDDLIGLPCLIEVANTEEVGRGGEIFYKCPVTAVYPVDALVGSEPPF